MKKVLRICSFILVAVFMACGNAFSESVEENKFKRSDEVVEIFGRGIIEIEVPQTYKTIDAYLINEDTEEKIDLVSTTNMDGICRILIPEETVNKEFSYKLFIDYRSSGEGMIFSTEVIENTNVQDIIEEYEFNAVQPLSRTHNGMTYYLKHVPQNNGIMRGMLWRKDEKRSIDQYMKIGSVNRILHFSEDRFYVETLSENKKERDIYFIYYDTRWSPVKITHDDSIFLGEEDGYIYYLRFTQEHTAKLIKTKVESTFGNVVKENIHFKDIENIYDEIRRNKIILENIKEENLLQYLDEDFNGGVENQISFIDEEKSMTSAGTFMKEDDDYIYYHDGKVYVFQERGTPYFYQKKGVNVIKKNKKTGEEERIAENIFFRAPDYIYYDNWNKAIENIMDDVSINSSEDRYEDYIKLLQGVDQKIVEGINSSKTTFMAVSIEDNVEDYTYLKDSIEKVLMNAKKLVLDRAGEDLKYKMVTDVTERNALDKDSQEEITLFNKTIYIFVYKK